jgi:hypothetical protein
MHDGEFFEWIIPEPLLVKIKDLHRFAKQIPPETMNFSPTEILEGKW